MNLEQFGVRIRQAREKRGISQDELAALIKKDQRAISEYETGKRRLAAVDLPLLAKVLDVSLLYFFEDDANVHDLDHAILEEFHVLSPKSKKLLISIARVFSDELDG
ncbi:helix-turn-helix domain-containing protein [Chloroflexota bacterium]